MKQQDDFGAEMTIILKLDIIILQLYSHTHRSHAGNHDYASLFTFRPLMLVNMTDTLLCSLCPANTHVNNATPTDNTHS